MFNNPCKYKGFEKKVKWKTLKTIENVDKMEFLLISTALKDLKSADFRKQPSISAHKFVDIHQFPPLELELVNPD